MKTYRDIAGMKKGHINTFHLWAVKEGHISMAEMDRLRMKLNHKKAMKPLTQKILKKAIKSLEYRAWAAQACSPFTKKDAQRALPNAIFWVMVKMGLRQCPDD